jgi:alkanesulfonate monooxygenase SsuD/methylene tetrahydromethanopterin reductase-like flavin-dependent oxidoreductase (luciferase family)
LGRAPGGDPKTTAALQPGPKSWPPEVFPQQVEMLLQFLEDANGLKGEAGGFPEDHPYQGMHAQPLGPEAVPVFMLGSGGDGAYHAAQFGLPYVYAHFINPENLETALDAYRRISSHRGNAPSRKSCWQHLFWLPRRQKKPPIWRARAIFGPLNSCRIRAGVFPLCKRRMSGH